MKGTIHYCIEEAIIKKYGEEKWHEILNACGYSNDFTFVTKIRDDIDELKSFMLFTKCAKTLKIKLSDVFDLFGEYWSCDYAPELYGAFYAGISSTKNAIDKLDWVHHMVTKNIPNAQPPRFDYNWINEHEVILSYKSNRGLMDLLISLIKGLNKYFNDACRITKLTDHELKLEFYPDIVQTEVVNHW